MTLQTEIRDALSTIMTDHQEASVSVSYRSQSGIGLRSTTKQDAVFTTNGEQGLNVGSVRVSAATFGPFVIGEQVVVDGKKALIGNAALDAAKATYLVSYELQSPVTIDPENP
jgi:hypothetical protein